MTVSRMYLTAMGVLLVGYAIFDKGFAYLGYPPIFVGEIFLGFSLFVVLMGGYSGRIFNSPIVWLFALFASWCALRTFPYLGTYGLNAIRDGVIWIYGLFAIFVGSALLRSRTLALVPRWYGTWFPYFLVLAPIFFVIYQKLVYAVPTLPGSGAPIIWVKPGDISVHLAGVAAFLGLGLHRSFLKSGQSISRLKEFCLWMMWGIGVVAAGSRNRGGLLSVLLACAVLLAFKPTSRINRLILPALVIVMLGFALDIKIPVGGNRNISVNQIIENIESVIVKSDEKELTGTVSWRLVWWERIRDETVFGDYFWNGRGFGENIAEAHSYTDGTRNRSPHNGHLTILARSGVPGLTLWLLFLSFVAFALVQGYFRMRAIGQHTLANLNIWALCYWLAFLVNGSFDVYLEGPQGGIWFWCVVGFAIALTQEERAIYAKATVRNRTIPRAQFSRAHHGE